MEDQISATILAPPKASTGNNIIPMIIHHDFFGHPNFTERPLSFTLHVPTRALELKTHYVHDHNA